MFYFYVSMNPTSDKYSIGDIVYYRYHRRDSKGRLYESSGPMYEATIIDKGTDGVGYVITYTDFGNSTTFFWAYDQEINSKPTS